MLDFFKSLIKLNKTLLLLSKIENGQYQPENEINFTPLIKDSIQLHQEMYEHKNLVVSYEEDGNFIARVDEQMAAVLISNLLKNAFLYTPNNKEICISVSNKGFSIFNSADAPLDKTKVFRRFYQPMGRREGSTGLGLSLIYSVCISNNLEIDYDYKEEKHIFTVNLKKSK